MIRTRIYPKNVTDACALSFLLLAVPTIYIFELFFVLPMLYPLWTAWYNFHFICGTFILINITSNIVAIALCDTSIKGKQVQIPDCGDGEDWRFCSICESTAPPRSWHCNICGICILKRDHHCTFTACCIGHYNQRYFLVFVAYIFVATFYSTFFNTYFLGDYVDFTNIYTILKIIFPLAMFFIDVSTQQYYLLMYLLCVIAMIFTGVLLYYHGSLLLRGVIQPERKVQENKYDRGVMNNVREVFGEKWYFVWIFPTVQSKLPQNGIHWHIKETLKDR